MQLINYQIFKLMVQILILAPVKTALYHPGFVDKIFSSFRTFSPLSLSGDCLRIGIQQNLIFVKTKSLRWIIWPIHLIGILKIFCFEPENKNGVRISYLVAFRNPESRIGLIRHWSEQKKGTACGSMGTDRKTDSLIYLICSVHLIKSRSHIETTDVVQRMQQFTHAFHFFINWPAFLF